MRRTWGRGFSHSPADPKKPLIWEHPSLQAKHGLTAGAARKSAAGQRNLQGVPAFNNSHGKLPTTSGKTPRERDMDVWAAPPAGRPIPLQRIFTGRAIWASGRLGPRTRP